MTTLPPPRRSEWNGLKLYQTPESPVALDLSDNTSRFGVPPSALAVRVSSKDAKKDAAMAERQAALGFEAVGPDNAFWWTR